MKIHYIAYCFAFAAVGILASCEEKKAPQQAMVFPPTAVAVVTTVAEALPITNDLPGRIAPTRIAEVRPRISGIITQRVFVQGSIVKEGDVLYRIDPEAFKVQVASAEATLSRAKAVQMQAAQLADRQREMKKANVTSTQQVEDAVANLAIADADVASAQAGLSSARLNLQYANVAAPIGGRIGRALITEGALVSATGVDNLATIQQLDPVYADFTQPAADLTRLRKALESGGVMSPKGDAPVRLIMDDGTVYGHAGKLLFSEATVDATTGQVTLRCEFPNPEGDLLPGMYVRVLIEQGVEKSAIAVPQQAVQRDSAGKAQIYVVKADNTAELRPVTTGRVVGTRWVISKGLQPGEKVIVEGFQKIRPGAKVDPSEWKAATDKTAADTSTNAN
ncbi:MAG: efflux transporter periplasmic adaptor subunit [Rhizobium sp.]|nr:efflux transporter periplasmic adaptor subunit [Rhizobium sp.]